VGDGVRRPGDFGGGCNISNVEFRCLMISGVFGACLGEVESLTGESGRVTLRGLGGGFRTPLIIE
jgi:hypothetical protein